ncbi:MAG: superoxide dismutase [Chlamydiales bacterium]|nr:superoxide dismutase [Chlamydiales bacterium]
MQPFAPQDGAAAIVAPSYYQTKDFSYLEKSVKGLSPALIRMHIQLYQGYVKNTNTLLTKIREVAADGQDLSILYGALKRRVGWEMDGMLLHEAYFENLGMSQPLNSSSALYRQIEKDFGSYAAWEKDFKATGLMRGIGWVILYKDPKNKCLHNIWINEHDTGHIAGGTPILVMDVWEHAYITEFGLDRAKYIDIFFQNINWSVVEKR